MKTVIVYENRELMVVHKPAGIATQTAKLGQADIVSELKNYLHGKGEDMYLGVVHRLDQPVEGLLVFARTPKAAKLLSAQLQEGSLKKYYAALVYGQPTLAEGFLEDYLVKDARTNLSSVTGSDTPQAKYAKLFWKAQKTLEQDGKIYTLMRVELVTGRHHQIRVQMSHAGMPLLGDMKYGTPESIELSQLLGLRNTALLASELTFHEPSTNHRLHYELPLPW